MASNLQKGRLHWVEQFDGAFGTNDTFAGRCHYAVASGATFAASGINGSMGRITLAGDDADAVAVYGPLAFEPDECRVAMMQVRIRTSDHDVSSIFVGFSDALTDTVIIEDEDGTLNTVATDAFGILLEGEQDETWQTVGVQNGTDNSQTAIGAGTDDVTVADRGDSDWETIKIEGIADDSGTMRVYLEDVNNHLQLVATRTSFLRSSIVYCPVVSADDRGTAYTVDIPEFGWDGNVGTSFD